MKLNFITKLSILCILVMPFRFAVAGVMAESTRIIFNSSDVEHSLMIANTNQYPVLVQSWVDNGDISNIPENVKSPFMVLPPVFKMDAGEVKGIKIVYDQTSLPKDRESVFWLNFYEIPPSTKSNQNDNKLVVGINTQMKIFVRPEILIPKQQDLQDKLKFTLYKKGNTIVLDCYNPTAYYHSFSALELSIGKQRILAENKLDMMVPPFSSEQFIFNQVADITSQQSADITFYLIDDTGVQSEQSRNNLIIN